MTATATQLSHTLPLPNAHFIWYCAWFSFPSALYAYTHEATTHFAPVPAAVFATSLLYWRNPVRQSWRRKLDITTVITSATYQTYHSIYTPSLSSSTTHAYVTLIGISMIFYLMSQLYMYYGRYWPATYSHASIHLVANVANIILYRGHRVR